MFYHIQFSFHVLCFASVNCKSSKRKLLASRLKASRDVYDLQYLPISSSDAFRFTTTLEEHLSPRIPRAFSRARWRWMGLRWME